MKRRRKREASVKGSPLLTTETGEGTSQEKVAPDKSELNRLWT